MTNSLDYSTYLSPFTTRYGTRAMREIWSEKKKRLLWRKIWVALARSEHKAGLVSKEELDDIISHAESIDIAKSKEREKKVYHELMSEIQIFSEQCMVGGGKIHLGATSTDILDNTTNIQIHEALELTKNNLKKLLKLFSKKIQSYNNIVCMGYTHLQPAEPTTLGYRFAFYAQDLLLDFEFLEKIQSLIKGKGLKGAVGTSASFQELLKDSNMSPEDLEKEFVSILGIEVMDVTNQTYPRKIDLLVLELLANIAASINKFAFDYRIMQSPMFGEWTEKQNSERVGSSAMPFKRNPDRAEKVCSLCRYISGFLPLAWSNPAHSLLERTLDDSASQRLFLPEAFLALDDCFKNTLVLLENLQINLSGIQKNLNTFGTFSATEPLLMILTKRGGNRQQLHELIKSCSMKVWKSREVGGNLSLFDLLSKQELILSYISPIELQAFASPKSHIGLAKKRSEIFLSRLSQFI